MGSKRRIARYVAAIACSAAVCTAALATTTFAFDQIAAQQDRIRVTVDAAFAQRSAFLALIDEETAVRGYVATGDPMFLAPYGEGRRAFADYRAHPPLIDERAVAKTFDRFGSGGERLQPYFAAEIVAAARGARGDAAAKLPAGKAAFDRLRRLDAAASNALQGALATDRSRVRQAIFAARLAMLAMAGILIVAGALSTVLGRRARRSAHLARFDELTQLPNRRAFEERLGVALALRSATERIAVVYIDLDGFKKINDRLGHAVGDAVLTVVGERLRSLVRPGDFAARLGGDEFGAVLANVVSPDAAHAVADRIAREMSQPILVTQTTLRVGASVGVAVVPDDGLDAHKIVTVADGAMYRNKRARNGVPS